MVDACGNLRVLIIDEHSEGAEQLENLLAECGCRVQVCHTGRDAASCVYEHQPQMALVSLNLPDMRGGDVAHELRCHKESRGLLLVSLSREEQAHERNRATELGFDYHIVKPVDADEFQRAMEQIARDENLAVVR